MRFRFHALLFFLLLSCCAFSQRRVIDSLLKILPPGHDTLRANALIAVSREMVRNSPVEARKYIDEADAICKEKNFAKGQAICQLGYGLADYYSGNMAQAEKHYLEAIEIGKRSNNLRIQSRAFINLGLVSDDRADYDKAISYYFKGLEIAEQLHDENNAAHALNNIGIVYGNKGQTQLALEYHHRSLVKERKLGDKYGIASSLLNIGLIFKKKKILDSCMHYYLEALQIRQELEDTKGIALVENNIASLFLEGGKLDEARKKFLHVLEICRPIGDKYLICLAYNNLAECSYGLKNYSQSIAYTDSASDLARKMGSKEMLMQSCFRYSQVYRAMNDFQTALRYKEEYLTLKDTIYNANNEKAILEMQSRYESDKKESEIELLKTDEALRAVHHKHDRTLMAGLVGGSLLFILLTGLVYNRSSTKKKANAALRSQNKLIVAQKEEITDSIAYALNIQRSMLPDLRDFEAVSDHFILHKPKDIVSGDFYFVAKTGEQLIFAAVDCAGHGVPGALMSFLGMDILQDAVKRKGMTRPSDILTYLDSEIFLRLRKNSDDQSVKDGMDLALCSLNLKTGELQTAGAYNPVYLIVGGVFEEIRPDKMAIGSGHGKPYTQVSRMLNKGDSVFVLSDGYADQFGGALGKKFKYKPLKEFILANCQKPMAEQAELLDRMHMDWKGNLFQVDDILIMGIKI
jgi:serine phosphatase RsbU (regulator of sigma subunit)